IHHSGDLESPLSSLRFVPYRNSFRHVVAWQSVAGEVRPGECSVHMRVSQKRALDDFILSLRISEQSLRAFWTARIAGSDQRRRNRGAADDDELSSIHRHGGLSSDFFLARRTAPVS